MVQEVRRSLIQYEKPAGVLALPASDRAIGDTRGIGSPAGLLGRFLADAARVGDEIPRHSRPRRHAAPTCSGSRRARTTSGSPYDKDNAEWILAQVQGVGSRREDRDLRRALPHARRSASLELVEPTRFTAKLQEPAVAADPTSNQQSEQLPTYNAYSIDGDVTAPLVYVNYGIPEDYEQLDRLGISVKGAIVIARYGGSWRGIKPKVAAEHGAVGCLIYSDPHDDGYSQGDVFPNGAVPPSRWRAARQRDGHAGLSGRSADARDRRHARTPSACR